MFCHITTIVQQPPFTMGKQTKSLKISKLYQCKYCRKLLDAEIRTGSSINSSDLGSLYFDTESKNIKRWVNKSHHSNCLLEKSKVSTANIFKNKDPYLRVSMFTIHHQSIPN
ncbi:hypothetical protein ACFFRR_001190 [Megaselia abdita]